MPPEALSWNDADDNNAFHEKLIVMDFDGSLSTELAMIKDRKAYLRGHEDAGLPLRQRWQADAVRKSAPGACFIPKGAKNVEIAKDFMQVLPAAGGDERESEGRAGPHRCRSIPQIVKDDPWWLGSQRSASAALCAGIGAGPDRGQPTTASIRLGAGQCRAALGPGACRCHQERDDAGGGSGQGVPAGGGDLREIHVRVERAAAVRHGPTAAGSACASARVLHEVRRAAALRWSVSNETYA